MKITKEFLKEKGACQEGMAFVEEKELIGLEGTEFVKKLMDYEQYGYANWLIVRIMDREQCVKYANFSADLAKASAKSAKRTERTKEGAYCATYWAERADASAERAYWAKRAAECAASAAYCATYWAERADASAERAYWAKRAAECAASAAYWAERADASAERAAASAAYWAKRAAECAERAADCMTSAAEKVAEPPKRTAYWADAYKKIIDFGLKLLEGVE